MDIGHTLRRLRKERGLSQRELASKAGLTNGTISLIEKNKTSPSVASLKRLLDAIPISMGAFFAELEDTPPPKIFFKAAELRDVTPLGADAYTLHQLGEVQEHALQMVHATYPPGSDTGPLQSVRTTPCAGLIVQGEMTLTVAGRTQTLQAGDGYFFDAVQPHRLCNEGKTTCQIVSATPTP